MKPIAVVHGDRLTGLDIHCADLRRQNIAGERKAAIDFDRDERVEYGLSRATFRGKGIFADGKPSRYFYWDDLPSRRLRPDLVDSEQALEQAKGWGFGDFKDGKPNDEGLHKTCFGCHATAKAHDFVFAHYAPQP